MIIRPPPLQNNFNPGPPGMGNMGGVMGRLNMASMPRPDLPLHIQMLFTSRPPLPYLKPPARNRCRKFDPLIAPVYDYLQRFELEDPPEREPYVSKQMKLSIDRKKKLLENALKNKELARTWNPHENKDSTSDPMKTLFVGKLSYTAREKHLKREFEQFGQVKKVRIIKDNKTSKPKGYAFIEFEHKRDFIMAYKDADGMKIDGKRILVDCERGRTIKGFKPRRFGGGKGETRRNKEIEKSLQRSLERFKSRSRSAEKKQEKDKKKEKDREREKEKEKDSKSKKDKDRKEIKEEHTDNLNESEQVQDKERDAGREKEKEKERERERDNRTYEKDDRRERSNSRDRKKHDKKDKKHSDKDKKKEKKNSKRDRSRDDRDNRKEKKDKKDKKTKKDVKREEEDHEQRENQVKLENNDDLEHGEVVA